MVTHTQPGRTPRRLRASLILLAAIAVLGAGILPVCAAGCCVSGRAGTSLHANMPCCSGSSIAPRDSVRSTPPSTLAGPLQPPIHSIVAHVVTPASFVTTALSKDITIVESSPPIYLSTSQFLI